MSIAQTPPHGLNRRTAFVATAVVVGLVGSGALVWRSTSAAFTAQTSSGSNSWSTGTVALTNSGSGGAVFNATGLVPGNTGSRCITVTYTGSVLTSVKLYGTSLSQTNSLASYVDLVISQGTATDAACTGWSADAGGALFTGTLANFAATKTDFASGIGTFTPSSNPTTKTYRIDYTLSTSATNSQQGSTASVTFQWEAQSGS